jgi:hypothetical protein
MSTNNIDELRTKEDSTKFVVAEFEKLQNIIIEQADKIKALTTFVDWVLDAVVSGSDICGGDAQDKMYELGILTREIYNPEIHTLQQGSECEAGDYIYFKAGDL